MEPEHAALLAQCSGGFHTHAGVESAVETEARLEGVCSLAKDYGTFRICLNGRELTPSLNLHAPELITKEVALGDGQVRKGGNTLTIEAVAPAPGFTECFFGSTGWSCTCNKDSPASPQHDPGRTGNTFVSLARPGQDGRKAPAKL